MIPATVQTTIWDELPEANVDTTKLEHLFESRAKDLAIKVCNLLAGCFSCLKNTERKKFCLIIFEPLFSIASNSCDVQLHRPF